MRAARLESDQHHIGPALADLLKPLDQRRILRLGCTRPARSDRRRRSSRRAPRAPPPARPARRSADTGARGRAGAGDRRARRRSAPSRRWPAPAISLAARATLCTASAIGTVAGSAARAARCAPPRRARRAPPPSPTGISNRRTSAPSQITKPPCSAAATLSGWPSISVASAEHVGVQLEDMLGRHQPGDDAGRARPKPPLSGIVEPTRNSKSSAGMQALERAHHQVLAVAPQVQVGDDREPPGLRPPRPSVQRQRRRQHVEAGAEVGRRGGYPDAAGTPPSPQDRALDRAELGLARDHARRPATSAVSGSLSPWPVSTQTTRSAPPAPCTISPATRRRGGRLAEDALLPARKR